MANVVAVKSKKTGGEGILLTKSHVKFQDDSDDEYQSISEIQENHGSEPQDEGENLKILASSKAESLSDMDYLKSKMVKMEDEVCFLLSFFTRAIFWLPNLLFFVLA